METFEITYHVTVLEGEDIDQKVEGICLEQSVELPIKLLSEEIATNVVGKPSQKKQLSERVFKVGIEWPMQNIGDDISQFLNILYGNISLKAGVRVVDADWDSLNGTLFGGPTTGIDGMREKLGVHDRALSCTALKPLGTDSQGLADLAYQFSSGGMDLIKDDHGLANQEYAPFEVRVKACTGALVRAAEETGHRSWYFPNITALASDSIKRYEQAAELGADGVLLCPHIAGLETMHQLARLDIDLPIIAHPAFSGSLTTNKENGLSPDFLYGQLWRALGADFVVYPNTGGRFSFTLEDCQAISEAARTHESPFKPSFPMPGGGMNRSNIPQWLETYGADTVFLIGSSLYEHPDGPKAAAEELSQILKS